MAKYFVILEIDSAPHAAPIGKWLWSKIAEDWVRSWGPGAKLRIVRAIDIDGKVIDINVKRERE